MKLIDNGPNKLWRTGRTTSRGGALLSLVFVWPVLVCAQDPYPFGPPPPVMVQTTPGAQRNALNVVRSQMKWFRNATQTAPYNLNGDNGQVWQQFQGVRDAYQAFTATLTPRQLASGSNDLAELSAGLDILQEAFSDYQQELANGQSSASSFQSMCRVLNQAGGVWIQEFNADCSRLLVGWP